MPEFGSAQAVDSSPDAAFLREIQRKQQKQPVAGRNGKRPEVRKSGYDALDKNSFLKLLVTQLSKQDPTNPMNDREFISQMAQFSSLEQMNNVANSMNKLRGSQASQLIGKMIEGKDFVTEKPIQGIVTTALYQPNGDVLLKVGGRFTKFDDVTVVTEVTPVAAPVTPVGPANVSRETLSLTPGPSPRGREEAEGVSKVMVNPSNHDAKTSTSAVQPQANSTQAAQAYEANQKAAEKKPDRASNPVKVPVIQINKKDEVSKGE